MGDPARDRRGERRPAPEPDRPRAAARFSTALRRGGASRRGVRRVHRLGRGPTVAPGSRGDRRADPTSVLLSGITAAAGIWFSFLAGGRSSPTRQPGPHDRRNADLLRRQVGKYVPGRCGRSHQVRRTRLPGAGSGVRRGRSSSCSWCWAPACWWRSAPCGAGRGAFGRYWWALLALPLSAVRQAAGANRGLALVMRLTGVTRCRARSPPRGSARRSAGRW